MKYWDTSALLRAWKEGWVPKSGITRSHTLAEWFHTQVGRGLLHRRPDGTEEKKALPWPLAASEAQRMVANLKIVELTSEQMMAALEDLSKLTGLKASAVYDYLHIRTGEAHNTSALVTLNLAEWARMTKKRIEPPSEDPPAE